MAQALEGLADRPYVFTKCAMAWDADRRTRTALSGTRCCGSARPACAASKLDCIDPYQIHWPNPAEDIEEGWEALQLLKAEGKVRWAGLCNFSVAQLERIQGRARSPPCSRRTRSSPRRSKRTCCPIAWPGASA